MALLEASLMIILFIVLAVIISSLPLYIAIKLLGGRATILKVFFTNIFIAIASVILAKMFGFGALIIILATIIIYMVMFNLGIIRAAFAWILHHVVVLALFYVGILMGITIPVISKII